MQSETPRGGDSWIFILLAGKYYGYSETEDFLYLSIEWKMFYVGKETYKNL